VQPSAPHARPLRFLALAAALLAGSLIWTVFIPGMIAWRDGVFYEEDIQKRLPAEAGMTLEASQRAQRLLRSSTAKLEDQTVALISQIASTSKAEAIPDQTALAAAKLLLEIHVQLHAEASHPVQPIVVAPFFLNPQLWLWPAIYFCLGFIAFLLKPAAGSGAAKATRIRYNILVGCAIYMLYEWPLWARNFIFASHGRTLYAYTNYDIDPASFLMQELVIIGFCLLLARIWLQWYSLPAARHRQGSETALAQTFNEAALSNLSDMLFRWQYMSVVLALGFGFFSNFFWRIVFQFHDQRYVISAISAHLLWAVTWIAISLPLVSRWQGWESTRWQAVVEVEIDATLPPAEKDRLTKSLKELQPGGFAALLASAGVAVFTFIFPIAKELIGLR
jgi:hypothetical protein